MPKVPSKPPPNDSSRTLDAKHPLYVVAKARYFNDLLMGKLPKNLTQYELCKEYSPMEGEVLSRESLGKWTKEFNAKRDELLALQIQSVTELVVPEEEQEAWDETVKTLTEEKKRLEKELADFDRVQDQIDRLCDQLENVEVVEDFPIQQVTALLKARQDNLNQRDKLLRTYKLVVEQYEDHTSFQLQRESVKQFYHAKAKTHGLQAGRETQEKSKAQERKKDGFDL